MPRQTISEKEDAAVALYESGEQLSFDEFKPILNKALAAFKRILKQEPDNITAHFYLARIHLKKRQYQKALAHAERTRKLSPDEPNIYLNTGVIYRNMGDTETGIKFYKMELARNLDDPENCPEVFFNLGLCYFERHRWKTASKYFEKSFELGHRVDDLAVDLAVCYRKTGEVEREIGLYRRYLQLNAKDGWAMQNLGAALIDVGEYSKSLYYSRRAKKIFPDEPIIQANIELALRLYAKQKVAL